MELGKLVNRRGFLRMLGTGAALGGVAAVAPSQVWPFRKIFLPTIASPDLFAYMNGLMGQLPSYLSGTYPFLYPGPLNEASIEALQLENFAKEIPDLIGSDHSLYEIFKRHENAEINRALFRGEQFRVPMRFEAVDPENAGHVKCAEAATKVLNLRNGNRILYDDHGNDYETTVQFATRKGYLTNPSPIIGEVPLGPPNVVAHIVHSCSLNEKPASIARRAARKFVDSLKVRNEDLGFEDWHT